MNIYGVKISIGYVSTDEVSLREANETAENAELFKTGSELGIRESKGYKMVYQILCCWYSLEPYDSNRYPQDRI